MGYQERAFSRGWYYVCMICDILCGTGKFQVELSSEVIIPWKWIQRPCTSGKPGKQEKGLGIILEIENEGADSRAKHAHFC